MKVGDYQIDLIRIFKRLDIQTSQLKLQKVIEESIDIFKRF